MGGVLKWKEKSNQTNIYKKSYEKTRHPALRTCFQNTGYLRQSEIINNYSPKWPRVVAFRRAARGLFEKKIVLLVRVRG